MFHNRCLRSILGVSTARQRTEHISNVQLGQMFGMEESLEDLVSTRRLRWLGHLARMEVDRLPKRLLFGWLPQRRPAHGPKMRWRDRVRKDMQKFNIAESRWFSVAQDRDSWRWKCKEGLEACTSKRVQEDRVRGVPSSAVGGTLGYTCATCHRSFRRRQDIARHKCVTTRPRGRVGHLSQT